MASNSFGTLFRITTWGEAHGKAVGVVIDGCPAGLELSESDIQKEMLLRRPGKSLFTSPRKEKDRVEIFSGVWEGKTTGTPISLLIFNTDVRSEVYEETKHIYRPGHAEYTYAHKYGVFDYRGSGRASARETACRVAAGAVAKKILAIEGIVVQAYLQGVGTLSFPVEDREGLSALRNEVYRSPVYHPDEEATEAMVDLLTQVKKEGDSVGGEVEFALVGMPIGLGDPIYEKLEANLAKAMMSLPASKGFAIGEESLPHHFRGSAFQDRYQVEEDKIVLATNRAGGTLGGISNGKPVVGRVQFKPTSSIRKEQESVTKEGVATTFAIPKEGRHDPCVAIRAVPVVEAMAALVVVDALLAQRCTQL